LRILTPVLQDQHYPTSGSRTREPKAGSIGRWPGAITGWAASAAKQCQVSLNSH